jgi:hypothetical protein
MSCVVTQLFTERGYLGNDCLVGNESALPHGIHELISGNHASLLAGENHQDVHDHGFEMFLVVTLAQQAALGDDSPRSQLESALQVGKGWCH